MAERRLAGQDGPFRAGRPQQLLLVLLRFQHFLPAVLLLLALCRLLQPRERSLDRLRRPDLHLGALQLAAGTTQIPHALAQARNAQPIAEVAAITIAAALELAQRQGDATLLLIDL